MGLLASIFGKKERPPEHDEIETLRPSMLQIKKYGGTAAMLKEFSGSMRETREPAGYHGFLIENQYLPRLAARACALMTLSDIKKRLRVEGPPTDADIARIEAAPDYRTAHELFVDADEIVTQATVDGLKEAQTVFAASQFEYLGTPGFRDRLKDSPMRKHVASLKEQSEIDWQRWVRSGTRLSV